MLSSYVVISMGCSEAPTELARAAQAGDLLRVESLLADGAHADETGPSGLTALHRAARGDWPEAVRSLLAAGADVDAADARNGWTPLMHAVHKGSHRAAAALLEAGAAVDARSKSRSTPLIMAAGQGDTRMVRLLLETGADPHARRDDGTNALWAAAGGGALIDFSDGPAIGTCFPETVSLLAEAAPGSRIEPGVSATLLKWVASSDRCAELVARWTGG